jgi:peptide/nickel transport system ATP-binding protein
MPGIAAGVAERPPGCAFAPRCPLRTEECVAALPALEDIGQNRLVRCLHWQQTPAVETTPLLGKAPNRERVPLLEIHDLVARYESRGETVVAADGVRFAVDRGACVALVGESGSGKTTIARAIAGLHEISGGRILLDGKELPSLARQRTVAQRRAIQLISQNPSDALNPRRTIRDAIERPARQLRKLNKAATAAEVNGLLEQVRLPARLASRYPAELSGGERQRAAIARALAAQPEVLLCDEVTSALDVSVQAAVLDVLNELRRELGVSVLFITHDLGLVAVIADQTLVLDRGNICERGSTSTVLRAPQHEYTRTLLASAPSVREAIGSGSVPTP